MRAIVLKEAGGPERLTLESDWPDPSPGPGDLLVEVHAAGVGPWDLFVRRGEWPFPLPLVLGGELSGRVIEVGSGVDNFRPGDEVWSAPSVVGVGYAELAVVPAAKTSLKPRSLSWAQAAAAPIDAATAHTGIYDALKLNAGETLLVNGAAGGLGTFAVQLAVGLGARVIATASPAEHDYVRGLGVERVMDWHDPEWPAELEHDGASAGFDCAGVDPEKVRAAIRPQGRVVSAAAPASTLPADKRGVTYTRYNGDVTSQRLAALAQLADAGRLRVELHEILPLDRAADAHRVLEGKGVRGKIALRIRDEK